MEILSPARAPGRGNAGHAKSIKRERRLSVSDFRGVLVDKYRLAANKAPVLDLDRVGRRGRAGCPGSGMRLRKCRVGSGELMFAREHCNAIQQRLNKNYVAAGIGGSKTPPGKVDHDATASGLRERHRPVGKVDVRRAVCAVARDVRGRDCDFLCHAILADNVSGRRLMRRQAILRRGLRCGSSQDTERCCHSYFADFQHVIFPQVCKSGDVGRGLRLSDRNCSEVPRDDSGPRPVFRTAAARRWKRGRGEG